MLKHRDDIDGLRAVAVLPVVLFHAHVPFLSGGYVGVDIFFVISGFLITSIVAKEIASGSFTFAGFYERRLRRILPALFAVLLVTLVAASLVALPGDFENLTNSLLATLAFASNIFFYFDSGYFSGPAETKPLLHTWSLAVEEQFYIVWPVILLVGVRWFRSGLPFLVIGLVVVSLIASEYQVRYHRDAAFYLLPARAWELLVGAVLALGYVPSPRAQRHADVASLLGLALIAVAVVGYTAQTPFPGATALLPCIGACLIIWAGMERPSLVGRWLSAGPVVFVGLISYSLYLWHWPVFVLAKYINRHELSYGQYAILIGLTFVLATLSWKFLETPLRRQVGGVSLKTLCGGLAGAVGLFAVVGAFSLQSGGIPARLSPEALTIAAGKGEFGIKGDSCLNRGLDKIRAGDLCRLSEEKANSQKRIVLWGDSHAEAMAPAFQHLASRHGVPLFYAGRDACPPLLEVSQWPPDENPKCPKFVTAMMNFIESNRVSDVVLVARWNLYAEGWPTWGLESAFRKQIYLQDGASKRTSVEENKQVIRRALAATVEKLIATGVRVWIVQQVPYVGFRVPAEYAIASASRLVTARPGPDRSEHASRSTFMKTLTAKLMKTYPLRSLTPSMRLCPDATCLVLGAGQPLYRDDDHLSRQGAIWVAPALEDIFKGNGSGS